VRTVRSAKRIVTVDVCELANGSTERGSFLLIGLDLVTLGINALAFALFAFPIVLVP